MTMALRYGKRSYGLYGIVDDLYYEYDGNRLCKVSNAVESPCYNGAMHFSDGADEETEYDYDADGNLIEDKNKGITRITYNVLNLPEHLDFKSGKYVNFTYSSTGEKLCSNYLLKLPEIYDPGTRSVSSDIFASGKFPPEWSGPVGPGLGDSLISRPDTMFTEEQYMMIYGAHRIDFCGDIIYENLKPTPNLILIDGGYVTFTNNKQPVYHFYLTDHQGNVRVVADENGTVEETNHYYPFGALFGESVDKNKQRYKYNGKELDRLLSLDWYDYGARWYDPVLARWHAIDPLAEKYSDVSPYVYCNNNAVNAVDPDGKDWYLDKDKTWQFSPDVHSQKDLEYGQLYKASSFFMGRGKNLVHYRNDGSILYSNETSAYKRMWNQADVHYRNLGDKGGREVGAFILANGKILILPDYKNDRSTSHISEYGYKISTDGFIVKNNNRTKIVGQIHTHQRGAGDPTPSYIGNSDARLSEKLGTLPVFIMGHDGRMYGIISNKKSYAIFKLPHPYDKVYNLLNGRHNFNNYVRVSDWSFK